PCQAPVLPGQVFRKAREQILEEGARSLVSQEDVQNGFPRFITLQCEFPKSACPGNLANCGAGRSRAEGKPLPERRASMRSADFPVPRAGVRSRNRVRPRGAFLPIALPPA